jgi:hypothetical protein
MANGDGVSLRERKCMSSDGQRRYFPTVTEHRTEEPDDDAEDIEAWLDQLDPAMLRPPDGVPDPMIGKRVVVLNGVPYVVVDDDALVVVDGSPVTDAAACELAGCPCPERVVDDSDQP